MMRYVTFEIEGLYQAPVRLVGKLELRSKGLHVLPPHCLRKASI